MCRRFFGSSVVITCVCRAFLPANVPQRPLDSGNGQILIECLSKHSFCRDLKPRSRRVPQNRCAPQHAEVHIRGPKNLVERGPRLLTRPLNIPGAPASTAGRDNLSASTYSPKLRAPAAAEYLRLSTSTLAKMRLRGDGPPFFKAGARIVLYDLAELETWLAGRRRVSTSSASS